MTQTKQTKTGRTLHRDNCNPTARKSHTNKFGDVIILLGRHGFEWSVGIKRHLNPCSVAITSFENRAKALTYYNKMCKQY